MEGINLNRDKKMEQYIIVKWVFIPIIGVLTAITAYFMKTIIKRVDNCATKEYVELRIRPIERKIDNLDKKIDKLIDLHINRRDQ